MIVQKLLIFLLLSTTLVTSQNFYEKVTHQTDPQAVCLDGSTPALYRHQGSQPENILIYVIGGNACLADTLENSIESCYQRSFTQLGSSKAWPPLYPSDGFGMMDVTASNKFAEWTKIVLLYCDGNLFQGYNKNPYPYKGKDLFFRGSKIMRAHLKWIDEQYNFAKAKKIVMAGISAGGMATYLWIDYLADIVKNSKKLYGIVDSGIFLDPEAMIKIYPQVAQISASFAPNALLSQPGSAAQAGGSINLQSQFLGNPQAANFVSPVKVLQDFLKIVNADERPPNKKCLATLKDASEDYKCLFPPKAFQHLGQKLLWIQSQYDSDATTNNIGIKCLTEGTVQYTPKKCSQPQLLVLNFYRGLIGTHVFQDLIKNGHSIWSPACSFHGTTIYSKDYNSYILKTSENDLTSQDAVEAFVFQDKGIVNIDQYPWPSNRRCAF